MKILKSLAVPFLQDSKPHEPTHSPGRFDVSGIAETIERALAAAGLNMQSGPMKGVTDTIHQALSAAVLTKSSVPPSKQVFHGDNDRTVNARNGDAIVEQVTVVGSDQQPLRANVQTGTAPGGRRNRRTDYLDHANQTVVEHWMVHGAGHAWSGGSPGGSFTDPTGPDASAEMIRFFFSQRRAGAS